ncbi:hypothetical protein CVT91_00160 [Candidatus Atribacteria bacterium HGW-Atribacteria-1]|nr:MAG: hypothetical protein CVT91_00160 [Candidatus Atribacteria bacterium HGW-Atribacteria-1]
MELDLIKMLEFGVTATLCIILIWRVNPAINGLKDIIKDLVTVVQIDSKNTQSMKEAIDINTSQVTQLRVEVAKLNGKKDE